MAAGRASLIARLRDRPWWLRWVADAALAAMECAPLPAYWRFVDDAAYRPGWNGTGGSRPAAGTDVVLSGNRIALHQYSGDPREPYELNEYASLDDFFARYLVARACHERGRDVYFLPDVIRSGYVPGLPTDEAVERIRAHMEIIGQRQAQQKAYYEGLISAFRSTWRYRLARRLLRR